MIVGAPASESLQVTPLDHALEVPGPSAWVLEEDKMCRRDPYSPEGESLLSLRPGVRNQYWLF